MKEFALIVAGGKGTRLGSTLPKQFLELDGKPIILHTIEAFFRYSDSIHVVLVLPEEDFPLWAAIVARHDVRRAVTLQAGGSSRFQSVRKGLEKVGDGLVAIHDGVRPLVSTEIISTSFRLASLYGAAVAAVNLKDSIRVIDEVAGRATPFDKSRAVDRSRYRLVQTPQTFKSQLIRQAYEQPEDPALTDDASVAESAGHPVCLFTGAYENIKITTAEDLAVARALLQYSNGPGQFPK